ncbi:DUF1328 family protein [Legionella adelaidensis]
MDSLMLWLAVLFLVIAILTAVFGFGGIITIAMDIIYFLFYLFIFIFIVLLIASLNSRRKPPPE